MAQLYAINGQVTEIHPADGQAFTLEELQTAVGGYIQVVSLPDGRALICNEEGKLDHLAPNERATAEFGYALLPGDVLAGRVLICKEAANGEDMS